MTGLAAAMKTAYTKMLLDPAIVDALLPFLCWTPMQDGHVSVRHTTSNIIYFL
jgi:hypothetical protein